jgi:hypothetical protein
MDVRRSLFVAALAVFVIWVTFLLTLAVLSGRGPRRMAQPPPSSAGMPLRS